MKRILLIALLSSFILACQQPQPPQMPAPNVIFTGHAYWDQLPQPPAYLLEKEAGAGLGPVDLEIYAYGAKEVGGAVNPGVPLEYRVMATQARAGNPPLTSEQNPIIQFAVIYDDGTFDLYGTPNVPGIIPSNTLGYDSSLARWVNTKGYAQGRIGTQRFTGLVIHEGQVKQLGETVNVR